MSDNPCPGEQPVHHAAQGQLVPWVGQAADDIAVARQGGRVTIRQFRDVHLEEAAQFLQPVGAKPGVRDEGAAGAVLCQEARGTAVGRHHALFYQFLRQQFLVGL